MSDELMTKRAQADRPYSALGADEDPDEATTWRLHRELEDSQVVAQLLIPGEPASKARARFNKQGSKTFAYTPEKTKAAEAQAAWHFHLARPAWRPDPDGAYGVMAVFFCETRQRRDVDNMLKLLLDGFNKIIWQDDVQVIEVSGRKVMGGGPARTEVVIYRTPSYGVPQRDCEGCGKKIRLYASTKDRAKYCSRTCELAARATRRERTCPTCDELFEIGSADQVYCSRECSDLRRNRDLACLRCGKAFLRPQSLVAKTWYCSDDCRIQSAREAGVGRAWGTCLVCGAGTSRKEYKRCNACRMAGKPLP